MLFLYYFISFLFYFFFILFLFYFICFLFLFKFIHFLFYFSYNFFRFSQLLSQEQIHPIPIISPELIHRIRDAGGTVNRKQNVKNGRVPAQYGALFNLTCSIQNPFLPLLHLYEQRRAKIMSLWFFSLFFTRPNPEHLVCCVILSCRNIVMCVLDCVARVDSGPYGDAQRETLKRRCCFIIR